ncbi:MurR/RpiR family transcriptional regulator [Halobacillus salinarum]|uniref:MurR/RpiR family transcriptional regulator n=1 Tax=Halobacillus salinarum TaxID=2932257 RepID=A0ABY4EFP1_9BACI|nr:MurR/RpiR family transcriptional regulator [Halobacillus salinarum]UOQ42867.1 MurR/RpiR family transcriptional regulator [Halobacillus salinarum]
MADIYKQIASNMEDMSNAQIKIAEYLINHSSSAPFLTAGKLAKMSEVSAATVVRFAAFLGFSGYAELQEELQNSVQQQLTTFQRLKLSQNVYSKETGVYEIFQDDLANLQRTMENLDAQVFQQAVDTILRADRIFILANRSAASLGMFLNYYLGMMFEHVVQLQSLENASEKLADLSESDAVIGLSFSRYTKSTVEMFAYANSHHASTIAITDQLRSPLTPHADISLLAASQMPSFIDSFTAPLSLINALLTVIGKEMQTDIQHRLQGLEDIWNHFNVFHHS